MELAEQLTTGGQSIKVSVPPALNSVYRNGIARNGRSVTYKTKEAKAYAEEIAWLMKQFKPEGGRVRLVLNFVFARDRDIDSGLKVLLDALSGYIYFDDKQISEMFVTKQVIPRGGRAKPYVMIRWEYLDMIDKDIPF